MIKGLLLDYDGVMTAQTGGNNLTEILAKMLTMNSQEAGDLFVSFWSDYLCGRLSEDELWRHIETQSGQAVPLRHRQIWKHWEDLQPMPEMLELVKDLRNDGYQVGLLTNVTPTTEEEVHLHGGYEGFDFLVRSCKVGFAKPDPAVYRLAIKQFASLEPQEILFVDDQERNLAPAEALGMRVLHAISTQQVINDIRAQLHSVSAG